MKQDLLYNLYNRKISLDEAYDIFESVFGTSKAPKAKELFNLSDEEYTANCHGAGLDILAKWRYEGWPDICPYCKKKIEIENYGWFVKEDDGVPVIYHIPCLKYRQPGHLEELKIFLAIYYCDERWKNFETPKALLDEAVRLREIEEVEKIVEEMDTVLKLSRKQLYTFIKDNVELPFKTQEEAITWFKEIRDYIFHALQRKRGGKHKGKK